MLLRSTVTHAHKHTHAHNTHADLLPPGSPEFNWTDPKNSSHVLTYAGYHESPPKWVAGTVDPKPIDWMAGEQYDGDTNRSQVILDNITYYYPGATECVSRCCRHCRHPCTDG